MPTVNGLKSMRAALLGMSVAFASITGPVSAAVLVNGGFETPDLGTDTRYSFVNPSNVPGWQTTDSRIEIWANGFLGVTSYEGTQHAELNAKNFGTLSQTVNAIAAGTDLMLEFAHRARVGTDVMRVDVVDLGLDLFDAGDDTSLFSQEYAATTASWVFTSLTGLHSLGNDIRLSFTAVSTGSGSVSVGNFLDAVRLEAAVAPVPLPATGVLLFGALGAAGVARRLRRKT